jgi:hypothetical protein
MQTKQQAQGKAKHLRQQRPLCAMLQLLAAPQLQMAYMSSCDVHDSCVSTATAMRSSTDMGIA